MKKFIKILAAIIFLPIIIITAIVAILYLSADMKEPQLNIDKDNYVVVMGADTMFCDASYLRRDASGLWELYITGSGAERGAKQGALTEELMKYQEDVFIEQIRRIIPSDSYLGFLRIFLVIFNRNIAEHIDDEYREEIAAMSLFCTDEYNAIGTPYERQLNYHAAHDIGHTMQQYMLVGCSSFGVWGDSSRDSTLLIGRNFDFYVGDDFAKNRIITFAKPDAGYKYASIGWAGMVGVLSGINEKGLTVTINAAKGAIPTSAKTPISILSREILQYASTIKEAYAIASSRETFVNESILIGSAIDGRAAIIEKTPEQTEIYYSHNEQILCTNHYQSDALFTTEYNEENIATSDSKYRYDRLSELLSTKKVIDYKDAVTILRDRYGRGNEDIGIGNEMTLNQSISHHSVVFAPADSLMWVSTSPWQSGEVVCYDLSDFFGGRGYPATVDSLAVEADSLFISNDLPRLELYRGGVKKIERAISNQSAIDDNYISEFIKFNPRHYYTYRLLGDYYKELGDNTLAKEMYSKSLTLSIPYSSEREEIKEILRGLLKIDPVKILTN